MEKRETDRLKQRQRDKVKTYYSETLATDADNTEHHSSNNNNNNNNKNFLKKIIIMTLAVDTNERTGELNTSAVFSLLFCFNTDTHNQSQEAEQERKNKKRHFK